MTTRQRFRGITDWFQQNMPVAESELQYQNPYQLLVSVILSAQCTDKRVNMTTPALFDRFPTPQAMADADPEEIYPYIRSISYPNNKAKNLSAMARMLCEEFGGAVPEDIEQLQRLPGVGRKTANVVGIVAFGKRCRSTRTFFAWPTASGCPPEPKPRCKPKCSSPKVSRPKCSPSHTTG